MEKNERLEVERRAAYERLYRLYRRMTECVERAEAAEARYRDVKTRVTATKRLELELGTTLPTSLESLVDREVGDDADAQRAVSDNRWYISYATMYATAIQGEVTIQRLRGVLPTRDEERDDEQVRVASSRAGGGGAGRGDRGDAAAEPTASRAARPVPDVDDESMNETELAGYDYEK